MFPDEKFDFVYSYAVFQHIPSREVVFSYLREARRVLKTGGMLRCQMNGLPPHAKQYDTWSGVRIARGRDTGSSRANRTCNCWCWNRSGRSTCGSPAASAGGLDRVFGRTAVPRASVIRRISNALTGEAVAPVRGPLAALSLWVEKLPDELRPEPYGGHGRRPRLPPRPTSARPEKDGVAQVNVALPEGLRTGHGARWKSSGWGSRCARPAWVRIMPAGPSVPRITTVTDGINLLSRNADRHRLREGHDARSVRRPQFHATIDGRDALEIESFCADPISQRYEFNFKLPESISKGPHEVLVSLGKRKFAPLTIEVA